MNNKNYSNTFSKEYNETINLYIKLHKDGSSSTEAQETYDGRSLRFFFNAIKIILEKTKSSSIIDFGCGKAKYYFKEITIKNAKHKNNNAHNIKNIHMKMHNTKTITKYRIQNTKKQIQNKTEQEQNTSKPRIQNKTTPITLEIYRWDLDFYILLVCSFLYLYFISLLIK